LCPLEKSPRNEKSAAANGICPDFFYFALFALPAQSGDFLYGLPPRFALRLFVARTAVLAPCQIPPCHVVLSRHSAYGATAEASAMADEVCLLSE